MELSLKELQDIIYNRFNTNLQSNTAQDNSYPYKIGDTYMIRTVTMIYTGMLVAVYNQELVLKDCHWIAETARWNTFISDMATNEHESYGNRQVIIGRGAIVDACRVDKLPIGNK